MVKCYCSFVMASVQRLAEIIHCAGDLVSHLAGLPSCSIKKKNSIVMGALKEHAIFLFSFQGPMLMGGSGAGVPDMHRLHLVTPPRAPSAVSIFPACPQTGQHSSSCGTSQAAVCRMLWVTQDRLSFINQQKARLLSPRFLSSLTCYFLDCI